MSWVHHNYRKGLHPSLIWLSSLSRMASVDLALVPSSKRSLVQTTVNQKHEGGCMYCCSQAMVCNLEIISTYGGDMNNPPRN